MLLLQNWKRSINASAVVCLSLKYITKKEKEKKEKGENKVLQELTNPGPSSVLGAHEDLKNSSLSVATD